MGKRRRGRDVHGILILDKPVGPSSNQALQRARAMFQASKGGHTGNLDPLASGVLPLCFGEATKFGNFLLDADKAYRTEIVLGEVTDSADAAGALIAECDASAVTEADVMSVLEAFRGEIQQVPPMVSALKHQGQPLYKLARAGIEVERPPRTVTIKSLTVEGFEPGPRARLTLQILCTKGTYIRSLALDIGEALAVGGRVDTLRRTASGPFQLAGSVDPETLQQMTDNDGPESLDALLLPVDAALQHLPAVTLDDNSVFYLLRGQAVSRQGVDEEALCRVYRSSGEFLGLARGTGDGRIQPHRLVAA